MNKNKTIKIIIFATLLFSFALRIGLAYHWRDSFFHRGNRYGIIIPLAENILQGKYSVDGEIPDITQEPVYPIFLAGILAVFGKQFFWLGVAIFQGLLSIISSIIIYLISKSLFNKKAGFLACIITAFYPFPLINSISIVDTTIFIFMLTLLIYSFVILIQKNVSIYSVFICGFVIAFILLTRDAIIIFLPFLIIYLFINLPKKIAFKDTIIILGTAVLLLFPWLIRNYKLCGNFVVSAHGAEVLLMGNSPLGWELINSNISIDKIRFIEDTTTIWNKYPLSKIKDPRKIIEVSKIYNTAALKSIKDNFRTFLRMFWIKFYKFWSLQLYPLPVNTVFIAAKFRSLGYALSYIPVLFFAIIGIFLSRFQWRRLSILYFLFISFAFLYSLTIPLTRYRIPLDIFLAIFCSHSLVKIYSQLRRNQ